MLITVVAKWSFQNGPFVNKYFWHCTLFSEQSVVIYYENYKNLAKFFISAQVRVQYSSFITELWMGQNRTVFMNGKLRLRPLHDSNQVASCIYLIRTSGCSCINQPLPFSVNDLWIPYFSFFNICCWWKEGMNSKVSVIIKYV